MKVVLNVEKGKTAAITLIFDVTAIKPISDKEQVNLVESLADVGEVFYLNDVYQENYFSVTNFVGLKNLVFSKNFGVEIKTTYDTVKEMNSSVYSAKVAIDGSVTVEISVQIFETSMDRKNILYLI